MNESHETDGRPPEGAHPDPAVAAWRVGELARRTGVSVRTLHHYDAIGLLRPRHGSAGGHRLYGVRELERLQQILSLKQLGFALGEIGEILDRRTLAPIEIVERHLALLEERIESQLRVRRRLEVLAGRIGASEPATTDELLDAITEITMFEKYYTPEQLKQLEERAAVVGETRIREVEREWPELIAAVRAEMEKGTDPESETMQALARRWMGLVREFSGGDPGLERSLANLYRGEPGAAERNALDADLFRFVGRAWNAAQD